MKKYIVLQQIGKFSPDVKEQFTEKEDAIQYAKLVKKSHWDRKYAVCEVIEEYQLLFACFNFQTSSFIKLRIVINVR